MILLFFFSFFIVYFVERNLAHGDSAVLNLRVIFYIVHNSQ